MLGSGMLHMLWVIPIGIIWLEWIGGRGTPFRADSNEFLFVSIALTFTEILVDCDRAWSDHWQTWSRSVSSLVADIPHHEKRGDCVITRIPTLIFLSNG